MIKLIVEAVKYGGIAQLARAFGSYPECRRFKSHCRYQNAISAFADIAKNNKNNEKSGFI